MLNVMLEKGPMCTVTVLPDLHYTTRFLWSSAGSVDTKMVKLRSISLTNRLNTPSIYWVPQKLPQIYTVITYNCIRDVAFFAVYICGNLFSALYLIKVLFVQEVVTHFI